MLLQAICALGFGLVIVTAFIGIAVVIVGGKSDEELGYKVPIDDLVHDSDTSIETSSIPSGALYEPGKSERYTT